MTTTAPTFTRRTSVYTIRIEAAGSVEMAQIIEEVASRLPNVSDRGEASVSFRAATDDAAALQIARTATEPVTFWASFSLTTGLGVHRREITHKSVREQETLPGARRGQTALQMPSRRYGTR